MGVPHRLFCLYNVELQIYADDTVVYTHAKIAALAAAKLKIALERIAYWFHQSCHTYLNLNVKTKGIFSIKPWYNLLMLIFSSKVKGLT